MAQANYTVLGTESRIGDVSDTRASEEDVFEDAPDDWTANKGEEAHVGVNLDSLLENIDKLVDKEKSVDLSSEEDHRLYAEEI